MIFIEKEYEKYIPFFVKIKLQSLFYINLFHILKMIKDIFSI